MLKRWFSPSFPPVTPDLPFTAIGDIHGRADLLARALEHAEGQIICVGDYVDRGPDSAGVLALLRGRPDIICLMGNHEEMMLAFLDDPDQHGARWLTYGGQQTLDSFGISQKQTAVQMRDALRLALGQAGEAWLRALPSLWQSGNVAVTHAGADPAKPMAEQSEQCLRWGHRRFGRTARADGVWVLRGHVIVAEPQAKNGVIEIDTGAYKTGRLSLAHVRSQNVELRQIEQ